MIFLSLVQLILRFSQCPELQVRAYFELRKVGDHKSYGIRTINKKEWAKMNNPQGGEEQRKTCGKGCGGNF